MIENRPYNTSDLDDYLIQRYSDQNSSVPMLENRVFNLPISENNNDTQENIIFDLPTQNIGLMYLASKIAMIIVLLICVIQIKHNN